VTPLKLSNREEKVREGCERKAHSEPEGERGLAAGQPDPNIVRDTPKKIKMFN
jgi:hypothetical protein